MHLLTFLVKILLNLNLSRLDGPMPIFGVSAPIIQTILMCYTLRAEYCRY